MALVLSLRAGQDFFVNGAQVVVAKVHDPFKYDLLIVSTDRVHQITDKEATEIMEEVFVSAGDRPQNGLARVAINAPREIEILRGDKFRGVEDEGEADVKFTKGSQLWAGRYR